MAQEYFKKDSSVPPEDPINKALPISDTDFGNIIAKGVEPEKAVFVLETITDYIEALRILRFEEQHKVTPQEDFETLRNLVYSNTLQNIAQVSSAIDEDRVEEIESSGNLEPSEIQGLERWLQNCFDINIRTFPTLIAENRHPITREFLNYSDLENQEAKIEQLMMKFQQDSDREFSEEQLLLFAQTLRESFRS